MARAILCPYGLHQGQCRGSERRVANGVWFDRRWQMIGWGDLADADFRRVAQEIPFGELFIVLEETPVNFGIEQCCWMVEHGRVYAVSDHPEAMVLEPIGRRVRYHAIDRQTARGIIERIRRLHR